MNKIAVVADIHANIHALNLFLEYLSKENIDQVINLGDFLQLGPNPLETVRIVLSDNRFLNILGNKEMSLINRNPEELARTEVEHQDWVIDQIGPENMELIKQIPVERVIRFANNSFLAVHSRRDKLADLPLIYTGGKIEDFVHDYGETTEYVLIGHTHLQALISYWDGKPVLNPGSLGCGKDGFARFAVIAADEDTMTFSFIQRKYDKNRVVTELIEKNVPNHQKIIKRFY